MYDECASYVYLRFVNGTCDLSYAFQNFKSLAAISKKISGTIVWDEMDCDVWCDNDESKTQKC